MQVTDTLERLDGWPAHALRQRLPRRWQLTLLTSVESTQDQARAAGLAGAPAPCVFVADHQSLGRGRQGRAWVAPLGTSLMLSVLLRLNREERPQRATLASAVALAQAVEHVAPDLEPRVKWPNDLMLKTRKVAGILVEASWLGEHGAVVVGFGVNVHATAAQLQAISEHATSLDVASGRAIDRGDLLVSLLDHLEACWASPWDDVRRAWERRLWGLGQAVRLRDPSLAGGEQDVVVLGVDDDGALRVRLENGQEMRSLAAEILL